MVPEGTVKDQVLGEAAFDRLWGTGGWRFLPIAIEVPGYCFRPIACTGGAAFSSSVLLEGVGQLSLDWKSCTPFCFLLPVLVDIRTLEDSTSNTLKSSSQVAQVMQRRYPGQQSNVKRCAFSMFWEAPSISTVASVRGASVVALCSSHVRCT